MEDELIEELSSITDKLGGTIEYVSTYNSQGTTSKKIVIEYNIEHNKRETV
tara:strand:+ start:753 stop:905 length:153 start_codon:yes stop_codon:yes gene_type:complete